jgi:hypothetical protein
MIPRTRAGARLEAITVSGQGGGGKRMKQKHLYLILAFVGLVVPYWFFISFLTGHGWDGRAFVRQLFGTQISAFFAMDLLLSSIVFVRYLRQEAARCSIHHSWIFVAALLTVGLSFALPLFLYARESAIEAKPADVRDRAVSPLRRT